MASLNIGIIGLGTVGSGTVEILLRHRDLISQRAGMELKIKGIADLDLERDRGFKIPDGILTRDAYQVLDDPEVEVVLELIGGTTTAREYVTRAIRNRKHVITANKALLAEFGQELFSMAQRYNVHLGFEASVAGGIPIVGAVRNGLCGNEILKLLGILNGTSNYILTKMSQTGASYEDVVSEAVKLGIAEDPPTLDVDGTDVVHKLIILLALFYGQWFPFSQVYREGITRLTPMDIRFAEEFGYKVRLLAICKKRGKELEARAHPVMIPSNHVLANVNEAFNALYIEGDFVGPTLFYGLGAGRRPTGSAVVSDLIDLARKIASGQTTFSNSLGTSAPLEDLTIKRMEDLVIPYYFRFQAVDKPGVLSKISGILGKHDISISSVIQKGREAKGSVPIVMLTHEAREEAVRKAISEIDLLDILTDKTVIIRVEDEAHGL